MWLTLRTIEKLKLSTKDSVYSKRLRDIPPFRPRNCYFIGWKVIFDNSPPLNRSIWNLFLFGSSGWYHFQHISIDQKHVRATNRARRRELPLHSSIFHSFARFRLIEFDRSDFFWKSMCWLKLTSFAPGNPRLNLDVSEINCALNRAYSSVINLYFSRFLCGNTFSFNKYFTATPQQKPVPNILTRKRNEKIIKPHKICFYCFQNCAHRKRASVFAFSRKKGWSVPTFPL